MGGNSDRKTETKILFKETATFSAIFNEHFEHLITVQRSALCRSLRELSNGSRPETQRAAGEFSDLIVAGISLCFCVSLCGVRRQ